MVIVTPGSGLPARTSSSQRDTRASPDGAGTHLANLYQVVQTRWQGWFAAIAVTLVTVALVIDDVTDKGFRRWWVNHALTTDTVAGLLVVLVTVLVVNQVGRRRQLLDRARAVSAQAAIMLSQAGRACRAVSAALDGSGDRGAAS